MPISLPIVCQWFASLVYNQIVIFRLQSPHMRFNLWLSIAYHNALSNKPRLYNRGMVGIRMDSEHWNDVQIWTLILRPDGMSSTRLRHHHPA
jgi:hypothetical protein